MKLGCASGRGECGRPGSHMLTPLKQCHEYLKPALNPFAPARGAGSGGAGGGPYLPASPEAPRVHTRPGGADPASSMEPGAEAATLGLEEGAGTP